MKNTIAIVLLFNFLTGWNNELKNEIFKNSSQLIGDFLWIAQIEVSNIQYREYLEAMKTSPNYASLLPDTNQWDKEINHAISYIEYYFRHPAYNNYPMVCISKQQATDYCNWLSTQINDQLADNTECDVDKVTVRLPTKWEWQYAARGGLSNWSEYPWEGNSLRITDGKYKGNFRLNFKRKKGDYMGISGSISDKADITAPVKSYWPNGYQLYNMCGNVSEMVLDNDYAYGGNWSSSGFNVKVTSVIKNNSSPKIGFRYVIEVSKWKTKTIRKNNLITKKYLNNLFIEINDSLSLMETEVSNELYNCFLRESNYTRPDSTQWSNKFWYANQYTIKYHWHPFYNNFPVVNISKKDVEVFCDWLARKYLKLKNYQVSFRLPTEQEWMLGARLKNNISSFYPWGGPYVTNSKGCYLCNFRPIPEIYLSEDSLGKYTYKIPKEENPMIGSNIDGSSYVAAVKTYWPNDYGLYNMSGNVAEMVYDGNFTKGGSWMSSQDQITINSKEEYIPYSPTIGFRLALIKN